MTDYAALAAQAYAYAEAHYGDKDARFDVIVECMEKREIAESMERTGTTDAVAWAKEQAGVQFERELNQAWDGPESVRSSSRYDPAHDPAAPVNPNFDSRADELRDHAEDLRGDY